MAAPLPVRLNDALISRIDAVATRIGLNRSDVIRLCLNRFLDDFEGDPEELLRRDWSDVLDQFDGRKTRYSAPVILNDKIDGNASRIVHAPVKKVAKKISYIADAKAAAKKQKQTPSNELP